MFYNQLHEVTLMTFRNGKKLRIYDCRGVHSSEWNNTHYSDDLIKAVDGCIKKGYEVHILLAHLNRKSKLEFLLNISSVVCCHNAFLSWWSSQDIIIRRWNKNDQDVLKFV